MDARREKTKPKAAGERNQHDGATSLRRSPKCVRMHLIGLTSRSETREDGTRNGTVGSNSAVKGIGKKTVFFRES